MARDVSTIMLPAARGKQLKAIAAAHGSTINELLEDFINEHIMQGIIPDAFEEFEIKIANEQVWMAVGDTGLPPLHPAHARTVAALIEHAATNLKIGRAVPLKLEDGFTFKVGRIGRGMLIGVHVEDTDATTAITVTPGMARDLARQLRTAADKAQGK